MPANADRIRPEDDAELRRLFESTTLPFEQWTHRAHVRMAFLYLREHPFEEALSRMRKGVQAYNRAHGVPEGPTSGYNETTTHAFMHLIAATMRAYGETFPTATSEDFCDTHPHLLSKYILRLFYSPERRMHLEAKARFIEPDLAPLPSIEEGPSEAADSRAAAGCYAVIFVSRRTGSDEPAYAEAAARMEALAAAQPGFLGVESARGEDEVGITVSYWDSPESIRAWRDHAEHRLVQIMGREVWYEWYTLRIARVTRHRSFDRRADAGVTPPS